MKEVTYKDWQKNPTPRMMWVWDDDVKDMLRRKVVYVTKGYEGPCNYPVRATISDDTDYEAYRHCAEIEEPKTRRMTNRELAHWLSDKPRRECKYKSRGCIYNTIAYREETQDEEAPADILIRENDGEWKEPLVEEYKR